jgi:hypothetical protein
MTTQTITQSVTRDEAFYLERFKRAIAHGNYTNGRIVNQDLHCELYKGFAICHWKQERGLPNGNTSTNYSAFVWEIGGMYDQLTDLNWVSQGVVTWGYGADNLEKSLKKVRKRLDMFALMYPRRQELQALSITRVPSIRHDSTSVFNAKVNDVVAIRAFGRSRAGIVVATQGSRFVVAYMTPSNGQDIHYKVLPLNYLFPKG